MAEGQICVQASNFVLTIEHIDAIEKEMETIEHMVHIYITSNS